MTSEATISSLLLLEVSWPHEAKRENSFLLHLLPHCSLRRTSGLSNGFRGRTCPIKNRKRERGRDEERKRRSKRERKRLTFLLSKCLAIIEMTMACFCHWQSSLRYCVKCAFLARSSLLISSPCAQAYVSHVLFSFSLCEKKIIHSTVQHCQSSRGLVCPCGKDLGQRVSLQIVCGKWMYCRVLSHHRRTHGRTHRRS